MLGYLKHCFFSGCLNRFCGVFNRPFRHARQGSSLIEMMIVLAISGLLIGTASMTIAFIVRSSSSTEQHEDANRLNQELLEKINTLSLGEWESLSGIELGLDYSYYLFASGTGLGVMPGEESIVRGPDNALLISRLGMDEGEGNVAYDDSVRLNHGLLAGAPVHVTSSCKYAGCLRFDGAAAYLQGSVTGTPVLATFSLSVWFNTQAGGTILAVRSGAGGGSALGVASASGRLEGKVMTTGVQLLGLNGPVVNDGVWHQAVLSVESGFAALYLDGLQVASGTYSGDLSGSTDYYRVGLGTGSHWGYFNGTLDDTRIYESSLAPADVESLWTAPYYRRFFSLEAVCRLSDSSGAIEDVYPCVGNSSIDASTLKATVSTYWGNDGFSSVADYLTRWQNRVINQTDWSGGSGTFGPVTIPGNRYASSSYIDTSNTGTIKLYGF